VPVPIRFVLNWGRRYSLWVFNFGLACCAIEFIAASMSEHDFIRFGLIPFAPGPRQADLMIVSGTVTDKMAPAIKRLYEQMPEPKYVISFGACSNSGGPYWDSYWCHQRRRPDRAGGRLRARWPAAPGSPAVRREAAGEDRGRARVAAMTPDEQVCSRP
jgi:NADH-quinone oxidoreductase B subunit